ncbi:hypothetical protein NUU61_006845 [Penicillium alfredii]|uniref:Uncharacterized protein n=1 Tax=Penicillium alfredii TaxID=1506179 RepID=A0A9W9F1Z5_9EURO|nr:uncharacterized protein NUU61_006845 [Penicillium alfredii]KAJ5091975.1 hypothetical protein NUU61_006845 [Penicillium alfredii]
MASSFIPSSLLPSWWECRAAKDVVHAYDDESSVMKHDLHANAAKHEVNSVPVMRKPRNFAITLLPVDIAMPKLSQS